MTIIRIIGNNLGGGARKHCYLLNSHLEKIGRSTLTFIPKAPFDDPYSDQDKLPIPYRNTRNWILVAFILFKMRHSIDYVHLHLRNVSIIFSPILRILKIPYVITIHAPNQTISGLRQHIASKLYKNSIINAKLVIFVSEFVKDQVLTTLSILDQELMLAVIHNGSEDANMIRPADSPKPNTIRIVVVGELTARKGIELYWDLIPKLGYSPKHFEFHFFGEGPLRKTLEDLRLHTPENVKVVLHGYQRDPSKIYCRADIHCILSANEAFGRVITEAMAYAIPTIARSSGAFSEIISNKKNGWIVNSIEDAARILLSVSSDDIRQAGKNSRRTYETKFTEKIFAEKTIASIDEKIPKH